MGLVTQRHESQPQPADFCVTLTKIGEITMKNDCVFLGFQRTKGSGLSPGISYEVKDYMDHAYKDLQRPGVWLAMPMVSCFE